ncbi:hypothetical protein CGRA01v4_07388 [Colletotrichum graminicola]|nr:hypothetical protein CGRA01v4_07388 [Colletotrichum graminicola]
MVISTRQLLAKLSHPLQRVGLERQIRACQDGTLEPEEEEEEEEEETNRDLYQLPRRYVCPISIPHLRGFGPATSTPSALVPIHSYARKRCFNCPTTVNPCHTAGI